MAGWLRGTVKEVVSGDSLTIVGGAPKGTVPAEKRLTLSSLIAPKLVGGGRVGRGEAPACAAPGGRGWGPRLPRWLATARDPRFLAPQGKRDGSSRDEPFAWASREWLRKKLIGQVGGGGAAGWGRGGVGLLPDRSTAPQPNPPAGRPTCPAAAPRRIPDRAAGRGGPPAPRAAAAAAPRHPGAQHARARPLQPQHARRADAAPRPPAPAPPPPPSPSRSAWTTPSRRSATRSSRRCSSSRRAASLRTWRSPPPPPAGPRRGARPPRAPARRRPRPSPCPRAAAAGPTPPRPPRRAPTPQVREAGSQQSPYIEELRKAQEAAQGAGAGLWTKARARARPRSRSRRRCARPAPPPRRRRRAPCPPPTPKDPEATSKAVRPAAPADFNAVEFLQRVGKSKPVAGVVEAVLNGSTLRVTLLPDLTPVRGGG